MPVRGGCRCSNGPPDHANPADGIHSSGETAPAVLC